MAEEVEILDTTGEEVVPVLIHLSERRIVPKIIGVEGGFALRMIRAEGERLADVLKTAELDKLKGIYQILGTNIAYITKCGISHDDLHCNNVIIENGHPVIIDWDKASNLVVFAPETPEEHRDSRILLNSTLAYNGYRGGLYKTLKQTYWESFSLEYPKPLEISVAEMHQKAFKEYGVI